MAGETQDGVLSLFSAKLFYSTLSMATKFRGAIVVARGHRE